MRATCPSCEAVYEIPDQLAGSGRRLRCTNCGHEWFLRPATPEAPETPAAPAAREPMPTTPPPPEYVLSGPPPAHDSAPRVAPPPSHPMLRRAPQVIDPPLPPVDDNTGRRRGDLVLRASWVASVLLVVLALGALWTFRHEIATAWPPAARLTGTPVNGG